jgi:transcriptional regulator with XRE-family HTH domain/putative component of toxin-antitoxin plasmid stabilization module
MNKFALKYIEEIVGRLKIFKLVVNNHCEYDEFEKQIIGEASFSSELVTIQARLQDVAECSLLPKEKFRDITPKKETVKEYEIKTRHLRVYLFHEEKTGRVIVCGGKKGSQQSDIKHFRRIKKEYLKQKKMITREELLETEEYWLERIQNEIFRQVEAYLKENQLTQTQFAEQLGVSKGYVSQLMKGEFNYTLKKLIELSLAVGKAPVLDFKSLKEIIQPLQKEADPTQNTSLNQVAEPSKIYKVNLDTKY